MKISYSQLPGVTSKIFLAPIAAITLFHKQSDVSGFALVDSGASRGVISTVIAEELDIDWRTIPVTPGFSIGGTIRSHYATGLKAEIYGNTFPLGLSIVEGISPYKIILGQADLFHYAKITFEEYKHVFDIEFRRLN